MRKETSRLLKQIEESRARMYIDPKSMRVGLWVTTLIDEDPGINILLYDSQEIAPPRVEDNFALYRHNPLFFRRAVRKAEAIAAEAWTYFSSQGTKCELRHYSVNCL